MHMKQAQSEAHRAAAGYALLEALVAVIVAAVGFIGAARMQTLGMSLGNSAQSRQKATLLGYQMTDRIRANRKGFSDGNYNSPASNGDTSCLSSGCTPVQLAAADVGQWAADIAASLPSGTGIVCADSTPEDGTSIAPTEHMCDGAPNLIAVKIWWTDNVAKTRFVTVIRP
jgi:type IV pilus assembly protein PilV